jgi:hypothetical protein
MGITEVTVPKQYVIVQATEPTGAFDGQLWYDNTKDLTYIFDGGNWKLITIDVSEEFTQLITENAQQQLDIIELQANASITPFDHDTLISDTFSDADGYKDSVDILTTDASYENSSYKRNTDHPLGLDLINYYAFDNTSGNLPDEIENNNGTNSGVTINQTGKIDKAYSFDGGNDYVSLGKLETLNNNGTISVWVYVNTLNPFWDWDNNCIINSNTTTTLFWKFIIDSSGHPAFICRNTSDQTYVTWTSDAVVSTGEWTHLVITFDDTQSLANKINIYKNNVAGTITYSAGGNPSLQFKNFDNTFIGRDENEINYFNGLIDELAIWKRKLSVNEVNALYRNGDGRAYSTENYPTEESIITKNVVIDLPTISGTVTNTELVINGQIETGASVTYVLNNGTDDDTTENLNEKNVYNLTGNPTKMTIKLNPKETSPTEGNPSIKTYCLKLWKA